MLTNNTASAHPTGGKAPRETTRREKSLQSRAPYPRTHKAGEVPCSIQGADPYANATESDTLVALLVSLLCLFTSSPCNYWATFFAECLERFAKLPAGTIKVVISGFHVSSRNPNGSWKSRYEESEAVKTEEGGMVTIKDLSRLLEFGNGDETVILVDDKPKNARNGRAYGVPEWSQEVDIEGDGGLYEAIKPCVSSGVKYMVDTALEKERMHYKNATPADTDDRALQGLIETLLADPKLRGHPVVAALDIDETLGAWGSASFILQVMRQCCPDLAPKFGQSGGFETIKHNATAIDLMVEKYFPHGARPGLKEFMKTLAGWMTSNK